ncbi:MAG: hypothetical protein Ct9H300mP25_05260 [Acidobacteriota bacterium]|nr:MAG: hypothetical protein Ct9H300mP25_05260 [Acidobacteriota bacterium]
MEQEITKYLKYGRPFLPLRFLNLLPLSHMFGQAMATFVPPMLNSITVFMRGFNPTDIARQIRTQRVSVLVCVPKILDVLRKYIESPSLKPANQRYRMNTLSNDGGGTEKSTNSSAISSGHLLSEPLHFLKISSGFGPNWVFS